MNAKRRQEIYRIARREVLAPLYQRYRQDVGDPAPSAINLLPIRPAEIITDLLGLMLDEPEEIIPERPVSLHADIETAGLLDRALRRIVIATKFSLLVRRFTQAHEVGHWFLHRQLVYHRDLPVSGTERTDSAQPLAEREANLFAAEILMPRLPVANLFVARYGQRVHPDEIDDNFAFNLSLRTRSNLTPGVLRSMKQRDRSRLIARAAYTDTGLPLTDLFAVSVETMAIRLEELDFVF